MFTSLRYRSDARSRRMEDAALAAGSTALTKGMAFLDGAAALNVDSSAFIPILDWTRLDSFYLPDRAADSAAIGQWIRSAHSDGSARAFAVVRDGGSVSILFANGREILKSAFRANAGEAVFTDTAGWPIPRYEYCGLLLGGDGAAAARLAETIAAANTLTGCYAAVVMLPVSQAKMDEIIKQDLSLADRLQPYGTVRHTYGVQTQRVETIPNEPVIRAIDLLRSEAALLRDHGGDGVMRTALLYGAASEGELEVLTALVRSCAGQGPGPGRKQDLSQVRSLRLFGASPYLAIPGVKAAGLPATVYALSLQSVTDAASYCLPPLRSYDGCCRHTAARDTLYSPAAPVTEAGVTIGRLTDSARAAVIPLRSLLSHCAVFGMTSAGKTTTIKTLITRAYRQLKTDFAVIEAVKKDYFTLTSAVPELRVYGSGADGFPLEMNPLQPETGVLVESHISAVTAAINAAMPAEHPIPDALERLLQITYEQFGWYPGQIAYEDPKRPWPVLRDVLAKIPSFIQNHAAYGPEVRKNLQAALTLRVETLCNGALGRLFAGRKGLQARDLLSAPTVIELADFSDAGRDFLMSLLLFNFHAWLSHLPPSGRLERLIVVEEAHRVFRKTLAEESSHGRNVAALENMLAEIRCSGTGLILADQRPGAMADGVFANTAVMISHAVGSAADRDVIRACMNLTGQQAEGLKNLRPGECLISLTGRRGTQHAMTDRPADAPAPAACVLCQSRFRCRRDQVLAILAGLDQASLRYHVSRIISCPYDVENVGRNTLDMFSRLNIAPVGAERLCLLGAILEQAGLPSQSCRIILANFLKYERRQDHG